jgi:hypothetical protein
MSKRTRALGLIQFGKGMRPEKRLSYDEYNDGAGPQPVVCLRCGDGPPAVASVRDVCVRCLAAVWLSRTTEEAMTHMRQPEILCMPCVAAEMQQDHAGGEAAP